MSASAHSEPQSSARPFFIGEVVEITAGMSKGLRGMVVGDADLRPMEGYPTMRVRLEGIFGERWIRADYLRRFT